MLPVITAWVPPSPAGRLPLPLRAASWANASRRTACASKCAARFATASGSALRRSAPVASRRTKVNATAGAGREKQHASARVSLLQLTGLVCPRMPRALSLSLVATRRTCDAVRGCLREAEQLALPLSARQLDRVSAQHAQDLQRTVTPKGVRFVLLHNRKATRDNEMTRLDRPGTKFDQHAPPLIARAP